MYNKFFREIMWRSTKWGTFGFHEDACLELCIFFICELCVDCWILVVNYFWIFGILEFLEFLVSIIKLMEFL